MLVEIEVEKNEDNGDINEDDDDDVFNVLIIDRLRVVLYNKDVIIIEDDDDDIITMRLIFGLSLVRFNISIFL